MFTAESRGDYQPFGYLGKMPVYVTTIILIGCCVGLFLGILAMVIPFPALGEALAFYPERVWKKGQMWRVITYPFFNIPNFFTVFSLLFVFFYGKEVEAYLGRNRTIVFYAIAILAPVVIGSLFLLLGYSSFLISSYYLSMATLVGFGTLYPNIEMFGSIRLKWIVWVCLGLGIIQPLAQRDIVGLFSILGVSASAFGYIRWLQLGGEFPSFSLAWLFRRKPKLRVLPDPKPDREEDQALASVDLILEKIAKQGLSSLTKKEKAMLEKGREELIRRERDR